MQITGLGTGLDIDGLVDTLMQAASTKLTKLEAKQTKYESQLSIWSGIKTRLTSFQSAIENLQSIDIFKSKSATSSAEDVAKVSTTSSAAAGKYHLHVLSVATNTTLGSAGRMGKTLSPDALLKDAGLALPVTEGSISVNGTGISIDLETDTLNTVLDKINSTVTDVNAAYDSITGKVTFTYIGADPDGTVQLGSGADDSNFFEAIKVDGKTGVGVTSDTALGSVSTTNLLQSANFNTGLDASGEFEINGVKITYDASTETLSDIIDKINNSGTQVTAGYDAVGDKLVLTAQYTGSKTIQFKTISGNFLEATGLSGTTQALGENAEYSIDEINGGNILTSSNNEISNAVFGLTLNLEEEGDTTITVSNSTDEAVTKIQEFVTQYNNIIGAISSVTGKDTLMQGDSTLNRLKTQLRQYTMDTVQNVSGDLNLASEIGLSIDKDGTLSLDEEKLKKVLSENSNAVYDIFNTTDGIATRLSKEIDIWMKDSDGIIPSRETSLNKRIDSLDEDIENESARLDRKREYYEAKFNHMDTLVSSLESQLSYVLQMIEASNSNKDD